MTCLILFMKKKLNKLDLTGQKFGERTVIKQVLAPEHIKNKNHSYWLCKCSCGTETVVSGGHLRYNKTKRCKGCNMTPFRKKEGECSFNGLYLLHKHRKQSKELGFELSKYEFKKLTSGNCKYCNSQPLQEHKGKTAYGSYKYNGIDRIDSSKGYIKDNCVSCCQFCNRAKNDSSLEEFDAWIKRLVEFKIK